jgi:catechol 2,3-dioxygenase-like lactoylglutathione lyase family enzyme
MKHVTDRHDAASLGLNESPVVNEMSAAKNGGLFMANGKLRHLALSIPDKEEAAKFYKETFGFERVSQSRVAIRLSDGVMNLTLLLFQSQDDAGDERGKDFVGLHHFGIWVDDIETMRRAIEEHGGKYHPGPTAHVPENAEHKFRDPYGIVFDISTHGWDGAKQITESSV